jgi:hypothetical protein
VVTVGLTVTVCPVILPGCHVNVGVPDPQVARPVNVAERVVGPPGHTVVGLAAALKPNDGGKPGVVKVTVELHGPALPEPHTRSLARNTYTVPGHNCENGITTGKYGSVIQLSFIGFGIFNPER